MFSRRRGSTFIFYKFRIQNLPSYLAIGAPPKLSEDFTTCRAPGQCFILSCSKRFFCPVLVNKKIFLSGSCSVLVAFFSYLQPDKNWNREKQNPAFEEQLFRIFTLFGLNFWIFTWWNFVFNFYPVSVPTKYFLFCSCYFF